MSRRPMKIDVGPFRYTAHFVPWMNDAGGLDTNSRTIIVAQDQTEIGQRETLLHELLHAVIDLTDFRDMGKEDEEKLVAALSPYLFAVLRANHNFVEYLQEKLF